MLTVRLVYTRGYDATRPRGSDRGRLRLVWSIGGSAHARMAGYSGLRGRRPGGAGIEKGIRSDAQVGASAHHRRQVRGRRAVVAFGGASLVSLAGALRFWRLDSQVFGGDEGHLVRGVLEGSFPELLYTYALADFSLPMAGFARLCLLAAGALDDLALRALPLGFGLLLVALPLLFRRELPDSAERWVWSTLLAVSPILVVYSRIARSYVPAAALCVLATLSLAARRRSPRGWHAPVASAASALAVWFHPIVLPLGSAAFAGFLVLDSRMAQTRDARRSLGVWAGLFFAASALFLVPGAPSLLASISEKRQGGELEKLPVLEVLRLLVGHPSAIVVGAVLVLAMLGAWRLALGRPALALATVLAVGAQTGLVVATAPTGIEAARIVARYLLPVWPWVLLWVASGALAACRVLCSKISASERWTLPAVLVLVALLFASGPLTASASTFSSFLHQQDWLGFTRPWRSTKRLPLPAPYRALGPDSGAVIEFPVHDRWALSVAVPNYQRVHRRPVLVSRVVPPWTHPAVDLAAHVRPSPSGFLAASARYLVLHRDPIAEEAAVLAYLRPNARRSYDDTGELAAAASSMEARLLRLWGPPQIEQDGVSVWDLDIVRRDMRSRTR